MRNRVKLTLLVLLFSLAITPARGAKTEKVFPYPIEQTTLENGLTVLSVPFDSPGIIAYYTVVRTGLAERGREGALRLRPLLRAHDVPRDRGLPAGEVQRRPQGAGGGLERLHDRRLDLLPHDRPRPRRWRRLVEIEADRFRNLKYDEPAFQKEARAVLGEYNKSASSPFLILNETMQDKAYTTHTYKHTTIGFLADVKDMPNQYAYSKTFFDRWYRPENCTIVVAGDVDHDRLVELVRKAYGGWERGKSPR